MFSSTPFSLINTDNSRGRDGLRGNRDAVSGIYGFILGPAGNCRNNIIAIAFFPNAMHIQAGPCWKFISLSSVINAMFHYTVCYDISRYINRYLKPIWFIRAKCANTAVIKITAIYPEHRTQGAAVL